MGLKSWRLSAALMGVHTLGRMEKQHSGFGYDPPNEFGWWNVSKGGRSFNNDYYQSMTVGWQRVKAENPDKSFWKRADSGPKLEMFLDTDLCLYQGKDLLAKESPGHCHWSIVHDGKGGNLNFCLKSDGKPDHSNSFPLSACCHGAFGSGGPSALIQRGDDIANTVDSKTMNTKKKFDVDFFLVEEGAATKDVVEFAFNETAWLVEFKKAWKIATENNLPGR